MARRFCTYVFAIVILTASFDITAKDQCQGFEFEQVRKLSLQDLGRMTDQKLVSGEIGAVIFIPFDEEDYPQRREFRALGLIFARVGDLRETPVGGYIWISKGANYQYYEIKKNASSISITFRIGDVKSCATSRLKFELKQMGRVYVNGDFIDAVK